MSYGSVSIRVDVDVDDVISEADTDDLVEELERRKVIPGAKKSDGITTEDIAAIRKWLLERDYDEALIICERLLSPKWASPALAAKAFAEATGKAVA